MIFLERAPDSTLFRMYAAVEGASAQNDLPSLAVCKSERTQSQRVRFILSATAFCCVVYATASRCWIPFFKRHELKSLEIYSPNYQFEVL